MGNLPGSREILTDGQVYIYVLLNDAGKIKIGKTTNFSQRLKSLGGSNSGGNKITEAWCSPTATWLHSLERISHMHFAKYRIENTEWFEGEDLSFDMVVQYVKSLFTAPDYERCNKTREKAYISQNNKGDFSK